jgi:uncharacterized lipoprotein YbaY
MRPVPAPILLCGCLALALASCRTTAPEILGRVTPRAPVELPSNAVLEVQVADVTRPNAAPVVVARRLYISLGAPPWSFVLRADSVAALDPAHAYAVQARVLVRGKPVLVSKRRTLVNPARLADTLDVVVEPVPRTVGARIGAPAPGAPSSLTSWNPPGCPATLAGPISPLITGLAEGSSSIPSREAHAQTERPECPPCPAR